MQFKDLTSQRWTNFWKDLTPPIEQNDRRLKNYKWSSVKRSFINIGVDKELVDKGRETFGEFRDLERQLLRFNRFFVSNRDILQECLDAEDLNDTFTKTLKLFEGEDHEAVRKKLDSTRILRQLDKGGEGNEYISIESTEKGLDEFNVKLLQRRLSRALNRQYRALNPIEYREWTVYPFTKKVNGTSYFFVQLQKREDGKIALKVNSSDIEKIITRSHLAKIFGMYFNSLEGDGNLDKLMNLMKTAESEHFILNNAGFISGDFIISVRRKFSAKRSVSLNSSPILKKIKKPDHIDSFVIKHKDKKFLQRPIRVIVSTFRNAKVIGAIIFNFIDRNFKAAQREGVKKNFQDDFDIPLGTFIRYQEPSNRELCQLFLENEVRRKTAHISVRLKSTEGAWDIYLKLVKLGILVPAAEENIITSYCFDRSCEMRYKSQDIKKGFCNECGNPLCEKNDITVSKIDEENIVKWLQGKAKEHEFTTHIVHRKILSKSIFVLEIERGNTKMNFIPITTDPDEHFLEVLAARYPDTCILTSKDNIDRFAALQVHAVRLYEFLHDLEIKGDKRVLTKSSRTIRQKVTSQIVQRAQSAMENLESDDYYVEKNAVAKNLGAELFEANCHALLQAMFGFSIWLGAKSRGQAVPDGRSVFPKFPSIGIEKGCFAWDTKFTIQEHSKIGETKKNQNYVKQLYADTNLRGRNSRGLVFISNKREQKTFRSTGLQIAGRRRVKILYMQSMQLVIVYKHYLEHQQIIENDENAKKAFFLFAKDLFASTRKDQGGKVFVVSDEFLNAAIEKNKIKLQSYEVMV